LIVFVGFLVLLEVGLRVYEVAASKPFKNETPVDSAAPAAITTMVHVHRPKGYETIVKWSQRSDGFRLYGDPQSIHFKILVLGDSYTEASVISDGQTYFDYIQNHLDNVELFSHGSSGHGTLEELITLNKVVDNIKPDLIVWQMGANDLFNNSLELEKRSYINNNYRNRVYLIDGKIQVRFPYRANHWIHSLLNHSKLFRFINIRWGILKAENQQSIEYEIHQAHPLYQEALHITDQILQRIRERVPSIPIVFFLANDGDWAHEEDFKRIVEQNRFYFLKGIPDAIRLGTSKGVKMDGLPYDPHWNHKAHFVVGQILTHFIQNNFLSNRST